MIFAILLSAGIETDQSESSLEYYTKTISIVSACYMKGGRKLGKTKSVNGERRVRPALTPEARENQLIAAAVNLAEKQLMEGTASSQVITHYLKLGSSKERLEKEKLERENELLRARTEALQSSQRVEELYANALDAMRRYNGCSD